MVVHDSAWGRADSVEKDLTQICQQKKKESLFEITCKRESGLGDNFDLRRGYLLNYSKGDAASALMQEGVSRNNNASTGWTGTSPGMQTKNTKKCFL